jgi:hypothetical protein
MSPVDRANLPPLAPIRARTAAWSALSEPSLTPLDLVYPQSPNTTKLNDDVDRVPERGGRQRGRQLRRMLEVGVHDHDPGTAGVAGRRNHSAAQTAGPGGGWPVHQTHRYRAATRTPGHLVHGVVVAVIDDQHLGVECCHRGTETVEQRRDVVRLVAGRHDHCQPWWRATTTLFTADTRGPPVSAGTAGDDAFGPSRVRTDPFT